MSRASNDTLKDDLNRLRYGIGGSLLQRAAEKTFVGEWMSARELRVHLIPGDLVEFDRGLFKHWGMYSQIPGVVYHVGLEKKNDTLALVTTDHILEIGEGDPVRKNNKTASAKIKGYKARPVDIAISEAHNMLNTKVPYDLLTTNCEFYCTQWKYGVGFTDQVEQKVVGLERAIGAGAGAAIGGLPGAIIGCVAGRSFACSALINQRR